VSGAGKRDIVDRIGRTMGRGVVAARLLMVPFYLGMLAALVLLACKFAQKLIEGVPSLLSITSNEAIYTILTLIDLTLIGNLILMVVFSGWENFVSRVGAEDGTRPDWMIGLDVSTLKLKLIASIIAIAAVHMLETTIKVRDVPNEDVMVELAVLIGFAVTGVLLAWMDRLSHTNGH